MLEYAALVTATGCTQQLQIACMAPQVDAKADESTLQQIEVLEMNRSFKSLLFATGMLLAFGCQSPSHPWAGEPYREPSSGSQPLQSTYAPMPSILPSVEASSLTPDGADPALSGSEEFPDF